MFLDREISSRMTYIKYFPLLFFFTSKQKIKERKVCMHVMQLWLLYQMLETSSKEKKWKEKKSSKA